MNGREQFRATIREALDMAHQDPARVMGILVELGVPPSLVTDAQRGTHDWASINGACRNCAQAGVLAGLSLGIVHGSVDALATIMDKMGGDMTVLFAVHTGSTGPTDSGKVA